MNKSCQERPRSVAVWLDSGVSSFSLTAAQAERLRQALPGATITIYDEETAFGQGLATAEVGIGWRFRQEWLDAAPRIRWLATPSAGRDFFHITPRPGVRVTYGTFHGSFIAETVVGMVLAESRGLLEGVRLQATGEIWPREVLATRQRTVCGSRAVIVGFGRIGEAVGRLLKPLGVIVTGIRRRPEQSVRPTWMAAGDTVLPATRLDEVLPGADHVILVLPSDTGTDNLFDATRLSRLSPNAVLYNVGRGNVIDEAALATALRKGRLRAACLDVFAHEPLTAASPLHGVPHLYALPHLSAAAPAYLDRYIDELATLWQTLEPR